MRIADSCRRAVSALLVALVVCASLAGAQHAHPAPSPSDAALVAATPVDVASGAGADLDCALCASASRLAHGAASFVPVALAPTPLRFHAPRACALAPRSAPLARSLSRAPPRLG